MAVPKKKRYSSPRQLGLKLSPSKLRQSSLVFTPNKQAHCIKNLTTKNSIYYSFIKKLLLRTP